MILTSITFVCRHYTPYVFQRFIMEFRNIFFRCRKCNNWKFLNKTDAVSVIQKLCKSLSLAVLCQLRCIDLFSWRDREKTINILELVRHCLLPGSQIPDYDQLWSIFWKCHEWQKSAQLNVTENRTKSLNRKKKKWSSWRIIDGLMQRSTHKINTLPHPEITPTIISLPFNRAHFLKNELKQAPIKILTVKRRVNEVRSFQAI